MTSNATAAAATGDQQKPDDPMKQSILIIEHKIRNLEKRKLKLVGYLQLQRDGVQLSEDQLLAASKFDEVAGTLEFARNLKKQLSSLLTSTKQKKPNTECEKLPAAKVDTKIKEVLMFQNILECLKDETVQKDLLTGSNGAVQMSCDELSKLSNFSKMVSPKRKVEEGKPLFEDQLKTVSKHYVKLIESKPNVIVGTTYANLKEYLLKIEKSGYLDSVIKNSNNEVITTKEVNSVGTNKIPHTVHQAKVSISDRKHDNIPISSTPSVEYTENKIKTIYFTNNNVGVKSVDQTQHNRNTTDSVFNASFDFLQDSQLEEDHNKSKNISSIPTQTFSSSLYSNNGPTDDAILKILSTAPHNRPLEAAVPFKETKLNHLDNIVNISNSNSWVEKSDVNWQNRTQPLDNNMLPRENWALSQMMGNGSNNDWLIKNNWVQMAEMDTHPTPQVQPSPKSSSSNFGLVTNGYTDNLNVLLQKSVVFNKQDSYPVTTSSNNSSFYQNNYHHSPEHNLGPYNNSKMNYDRSHPNDFNKRSVSSKPKISYTGEGDLSRNYQHNNIYAYNNRSYKNHSQFQNNDYSRISRHT